jgi:hypothetical protein
MRGREIITVAAAVLRVAAADAQPPPSATAHTQRGVALYKLGKYEDAIVEFEAAYQEFQSDALLFNLAQAHRKLEHCERALMYYHQFLAGSPAPPLAQQVEKLLPELEAACRTRDARPDGPVASTGLEARAPQVAAADTASSEPPASTDRPGPDVEQRADAPAASPLRIAADAVGGEVISAGNAPVVGVHARATWSGWVSGVDLGAATGVSEVFRSTGQATLVQLALAAEHDGTFSGGRWFVAGEVGAEYIASLGGSRDVVPGSGAAAQWAPLFRGEVGVEHDISPLFAVRGAISAALCPQVGALEAAVGDLDLVIGIRVTP